MKGVVFVKLNEFVDQVWGDEFWEELLDEAQLSSGGVYTTVATYDDEELFCLLKLIELKKGVSIKESQYLFGKWVFKELYNIAPKGAHDFVTTFEFLHAVQDFIHVEVKKLNPDALLPEFDFIDESKSHLSFHYKSPRKMCFFCEGLIAGLAEHTGEQVNIRQSECEHESGSRCVINVEIAPLND
jgi:predicted hydrocarbon binding protein